MKTNTLNKNVWINIILSVLILTIILLGFGKTCIVNNGPASFSITFFQYAFGINLSSHLSGNLYCTALYIILFIFLVASFGFSITNLILNLTNKRKYKLEYGFIIAIIVALGLSFLTAILSKVIFVCDLKHIELVTPSQFEKLWENSRVGLGAICASLISIIAIVSASFILFFLKKEKNINKNK